MGEEVVSLDAGDDDVNRADSGKEPNNCTEKGIGFHWGRAESPNDPKLSDRRGWRDRCVVGGKVAGRKQRA